MQNMLLRNVGYFFIWADFYALVLGVHALFVGAVDFGFYVQEYFQAARVFLDWFASWNPITLYCVSFFLQVASCLGFSVSIHDFDTDRVVACKKIQLAGGID